MPELLFFYGTECPHCVKMEAIVDKLNGEGYVIRKIETWHNEENDKLFVKLDCGTPENDGEPCGGVPFLLNQYNGKTICGEGTYEEVKNWAEAR